MIIAFFIMAEILHSTTNDRENREFLTLAVFFDSSDFSFRLLYSDMLQLV